MPIFFVVFVTLHPEFSWPAKGNKRSASFFKFLQSRGRVGFTLVNGVDLNAMAGAGNVQSPIPRAPDKCRLSIERIVPASDRKISPTLSIERKVDVPRPPRELVFLGQILRRYFVPDESTISRNFDAFRPASTPRISPTFNPYGTVMNNDLLIPRFHDSRRDGHFLDLNTPSVHLVVLSDLLVKVEILARLYRSTRGFRDGFDTIKPFAGTCTDVAKDNCTKWEAMYLGQGLAVHGPGKHYFIGFNFRPWYTDDVVHEVALSVTCE